MNLSHHFARIIELKKFEELIPTLENNFAPVDTLILFDLDDVLVTPKSHCGSYRWWEEQLDRLEKEGNSAEQAVNHMNEVFIRIQQHLSYVPVEAQTHALFKKLLLDGYALMGLTGRAAGSATLSSQQLKEIGIEFSSAPSVNFPLIHYHQGIIFCDGLDKGEKLNTVLTDLEVKPKNILFIDDVLNNLISVQTLITKLYPNINFLGIHYTHVKSYTAFDSATAKQEWLSIEDEHHHIIRP